MFWDMVTHSTGKVKTQFQQTIQNNCVDQQKGKVLTSYQINENLLATMMIMNLENFQ